MSKPDFVEFMERHKIGYQARRKFRNVKDEDLPSILLEAARSAYANYYGPEDAEAFALYNAGYWFSIWANTQYLDEIADALGVSEDTYRAARQKAQIVAIGSEERAFKDSYDEFLKNLSAAIYE